MWRGCDGEQWTWIAIATGIRLSGSRATPPIRKNSSVPTGDRAGQTLLFRPTEGSFASNGPATSPGARSEEHTSELQSLMRNSYAVFRLIKKNHTRYKVSIFTPSHTYRFTSIIKQNV